MQTKIDLINEKISEFESLIDAYRATLNTEGVWLFLASLGCWGVNDAIVQLSAIAITFIIFSYRIYSQMSFKGLFSSKVKDLEKMISEELEKGDAQDARLLRLYQVRDKKLSTITHIKSIWIFLICYSFLSITLWHWYKTFCK